MINDLYVRHQTAGVSLTGDYHMSVHLQCSEKRHFVSLWLVLVGGSFVIELAI